MSEVKRIIVLIVIPGDTSQCVRNESYVLRSRSLSSCGGHDARFFNEFANSGQFSPVLHKHSKNFSLEDSLAVGVDRTQRNFEPMRRQVESWRAQQLSTAAPKLTIYRAFIDETPGEERPRTLFQHEEYESRPCGACRTRSQRRLRNSIPFHNSGRRRSGAGFLKRPGVPAKLDIRSGRRRIAFQDKPENHWSVAKLASRLRKKRSASSRKTCPDRSEEGRC
jgi:hypothetical protein